MITIPEFKDEFELAEWVDANDVTDLMEEWEEVEPLPVRLTQFSTRSLDLQMRSEHIDALEAFASRKGIPSQLLVRRWLLERLQIEAPDLLVTV